MHTGTTTLSVQIATDYAFCDVRGMVGESKITHFKVAFYLYDVNDCLDTDRTIKISTKYITPEYYSCFYKYTIATHWLREKLFQIHLSLKITLIIRYDRKKYKF